MLFKNSKREVVKKKDDTMAEKITRIFQVLHFKPFLNCIYFSNESKHYDHSQSKPINHIIL